jgi:glucose-1-phosphate thymidylyltransferase
VKGIVLAGGSGTRLHPVTRAVSKQLLPVYDKPMVYYPMSLLMLAGIREVLLISTPRDLPAYRELLGDGSHFGLSLSYCEQERPEGLAHAFILGRDFLQRSPCCLVLGDNILYGHGLSMLLQESAKLERGGRIFGYWVRDPQRYGVVELDPRGRPLSIEEKPQRPRSHYAVPGLYFYGPEVCDRARELAPSARGELEITDLNRIYLERGELEVELLGRGFAWLDAGTHRSLIEASNFIQAIEERQGLKVGCLQEIAWRQGWIGTEEFRQQAEEIASSSYGAYLLDILSHEENAGGTS